VRCDGSGRPIAFSVRDVDQNGRDADAYIDARDFVYLAPKRIKRTSAARRSTGGSSPQLDQLDSYLDSVTKAAIMGAIFGLIEKADQPGER
jgi:hypothetical protein